jgi:hypothetical protein
MTAIAVPCADASDYLFALWSDRGPFGGPVPMLGSGMNLGPLCYDPIISVDRLGW